MMPSATHPPGYWKSPWPGEDGGPQRRARPHGVDGLAIGPDEELAVTSRDAVVATMVVLRDPGEVYLLRHTIGADAVAWVERIDPVTCETLERSPDLPGGKMWPGGLAVHANGALYTAFGNHAHRLSPDLRIEAARELPRDRPYNSFVILESGMLATKDFGGVVPSAPSDPASDSCEVVLLDPDNLEIAARCALPEASIARLSADGNTIFVVGDTHLFRIHWDGGDLTLDPDFRPRYRTLPGQTFGWDAVINGGAAWFLDNGAGSENFGGSFRGKGVSGALLHLVRVDLADGSVTLTEICGEPGGIIANPPLVDSTRGIAVGYDSGNGVLTAFDVANHEATVRWQREQNHACHPILFTDTGELITADYDTERMMDQLVVLDIETGIEAARVDTGSPLQSVVFLAPGFARDLYYCAFPCVSRLHVAPRRAR